MKDSDEDLLQRSIGGDEIAFDRLFARNRDRLQRSVRASLHPLVRSRVDESDIIQEAYIKAATGIRNFEEQKSRSFFLWLRFIANQQVMQAHRNHLDVQKRSLHQQISLHADSALSTVMAASIKSMEGGGPLTELARNEITSKIHELLATSMSESDREILRMRHFELLTNEEIAEALDISRTSASTRYVRALTRLRTLIHNQFGSGVDVG